MTTSNKEQPERQLMPVNTMPSSLEELQSEVHLAELGFTENLPKIMREINKRLGDRHNAVPREIDFTFRTHPTNPDVTRRVERSYGPTVRLKIVPRNIRNSGSRLEIGFNYDPRFKPPPISEILSQHMGLQFFEGNVANAGLEEFKDFVYSAIPGKEHIFLMPDYIEYATIDDKEVPIEMEQESVYLSSLTEEMLSEFRESNTDAGIPYQIVTEDVQDISKPYDPFLVFGFSQQKKGTSLFRIRGLVYDTRTYGGSGEDIERILVALNDLIVKYPLIF